ncbi:MAG TPA: hypothetical protein VNI83_05240 [Vicinamibacterales bacterium]|nr:hypothetical protein [Vicinamibacterales bacterium]
MTSARLRRLGKRILELGPGDGHWPWLQEDDGTIIRPLSKRCANKFILGCIIDYQKPADQAWRDAARLADDELGDPPDLWGTIGKLSHAQWQSRRARYLWLHRFPAAHERVWRIARAISEGWQGDARRIWRGQAPEEVKRRFMELRLGAQLSRMAVGALIDTRHIHGIGDVKADLHVRRVLGRLLRGVELSAEAATRITRAMYPKNPWRLDSALYSHGKNICTAQPFCEECPLSRACAFPKRRPGRAR